MKRFSIPGVIIFMTALLLFENCKKIVPLTGSDPLTDLNSNTTYFGPSFQVNPDTMTVDNTVIMKVDSPTILIIPAQGFQKDSFSFTAPSANISALAYRFGANGPITVMPTSNFYNSVSYYYDTTLGKTYMKLRLPGIYVSNKVCGSLANGCYTVPVYLYALTTAGKISAPSVSNAAIMCGQCTDPGCAALFNYACNTFPGEPGNLRFNLTYSRGVSLYLCMQEPNSNTTSCFGAGFSSLYGGQYLTHCDCNFCPNGPNENIFYKNAPAGNYCFYVGLNGSCLELGVPPTATYKVTVIEGSEVKATYSGTLSTGTYSVSSTQSCFIKN